MVTALVGCSVQAIKQERSRELIELGTIYVDTTADPPATTELSGNLGNPAVFRAEDLTLHTYPLEFKQLKALHEATRKAAERRRDAAVTPGQGAAGKADGSRISGAEAAAMVVLAPVAVGGMLLALPYVAVDMAIGSAIVAAGEDDRPAQMAGRQALFVYDRNGSYRWHACCLRPNAEDADFPNLAGLPSSTIRAAAPGRLPASYRVDRVVLRCHRAKAGDRTAQREMLDDFDEMVPDPMPAYYWARVLEDNPATGSLSRIDRVRAALPADVLEAAEFHYAATPLQTVDCRGTAQQLIAALDSGSVGPKLAQ